MERALKRAIRIAGGQAAFANLFKAVSPQRVWYWVHKGKKLPGEFVLQAETATGVSRHKLRPDIYPQEA